MFLGNHGSISNSFGAMDADSFRYTDRHALLDNGNTADDVALKNEPKHHVLLTHSENVLMMIKHIEKNCRHKLQQKHVIDQPLL